MKNRKPPLIARKLLKWLIAESIYDEVIGDLNELFDLRKQQQGLAVARWYFLKDTFLSIRNFRLRRKSKSQNTTAMYKNYFKIAYRNMLRHKFYSTANILSLSFGIASALLIVLFIKSEVSFDKFHENATQLYRLNKVNNGNSGAIKNSESSGSFGPTMLEEFPEVEAVVRYENWGSMVFTHGDKNLRVEEISFAEENFLEVFDFKLIRGNAAEVLKGTTSIVLTESTAAALFGTVNPINQFVKGMNGVDFMVTGILEDVPQNSHLQFDALISWNATVPGTGPLSVNWMNNWNTQGISTYLMLKPGADVAAVHTKLPAFEEKHIPERAERYDFYLQPFADIYLHSADIQFSEAMTGTRFIYVMASIALAILLIAIFNYVNISTSKATLRAKEVGVRKVVGARRSQLIWQQLSESFLVVMLATIIGAVLTYGAMPFFNEFTGRSLSFDLIDGQLLFIIALLIPVVVLASGIYPAMMVAGYRAVTVLKSTASVRAGGNSARQVLITLQFVITMVMIVGTFMISRQTQFMHTADLGYNKNNVLMTELSDGLYADREAFVNALKANQYTSNLSMSQQTPKMSNIGYSVYPDGVKEREMSARLFRVDQQFIELYEMEMLAGRNFNEEISSDNRSAIINQTMLEQSGWEDPIGKTIGIGDEDLYQVIGVVDDFNFYSLHKEVEPIVMQTTERPYSVSIKVSEATRQQAIKALEDIWLEHETREPLSYTFLEDDLAAFYDNESNILQAIMIFAIISVVISCFGLYGLTAFTVERKLREVGIRKVLGAGEMSVIFLINKRFLMVLLIALCLGVPAGYYLMDLWLQGFAFRVSMGAEPFIMATAVLLSITLLTVSLLTVRAARMNPANVLRAE